jgi:hypothetical protein
LSLTIAYRFSVWGFVRFAYGTGAGVDDQSADKNLPYADE